MTRGADEQRQGCEEEAVCVCRRSGVRSRDEC
jgi:hypothetical protein